MSTPQEGMEGIAARCRADGGLCEVSLGDLREELGYKKLGRYVLAEVAESLEKAELGYFPVGTLDPAQNTEPRQWQTIWIFERNNDLRAQVIGAVLNPDKHNVRMIMDGLVAGRAEALTAEEKLERIRALVSA
jgi:hypothetical protein